MEYLEPGTEVCLITQTRKKQWVEFVTIRKNKLFYWVWDGCDAVNTYEDWQIKEYVTITE